MGPKDDKGQYHIDGIMPIDEWCDQDTGCARPGIADDPQMNGACIAALRFALEAASLLGETPVPPAWTDVADNLALPFDSDLGIHRMPSGPDGKSIVKEASASGGKILHAIHRICEQMRAEAFVRRP